MIRAFAGADAAGIGLSTIDAGEAVRQVIVEAAHVAVDIVLDFNSFGELLGVEVVGTRVVLPEPSLAFGGQ
jgi:uncharacterized protein YuzE